jgi:recombinational DNA repair protein (RecF pathway)
MHYDCRACHITLDLYACADAAQARAALEALGWSADGQHCDRCRQTATTEKEPTP